MGRKNQNVRAQGDTSSRRKINQLEQMLANNVVAISSELPKKTWTKHDMKLVQPRGLRQTDMYNAYAEGLNVAATGSAGTGKTFLALTLAFNSVLDPRSPQDRVIIVRSVVPTRDIGFLPGTAEEKVAVYEQPYKDILQDLFGKVATYENMKEAGLVEFVPTSFIRGLTWEGAVVVIDEAQNLTDHEINSVMTRLGEDTRVIFAGDTVQNDLDGRRGNESGFAKALNILGKMEEFSIVQFGVEDIVRSKLVKQWITAYEGYGQKPQYRDKSTRPTSLLSDAQMKQVAADCEVWLRSFAEAEEVKKPHKERPALLTSCSHADEMKAVRKQLLQAVTQTE